MFDIFDQGSKAYAKRTETMLREAMFARLEHEAAAEHHQWRACTPSALRACKPRSPLAPGARAAPSPRRRFPTSRPNAAPASAC